MFSDLDVAMHLARTGGATAHKRFRTSLEVRQKDGASDLVTAADLEAEAAMLRMLDKMRPQDGVYSEEGARREAERQWLIDPLDGTLEFVRERPNWSCAVCLLVDGQPEVSAVYDPCSRDMFYAQRDSGTWHNGRRISVAGPEVLDQALIRSYASRVVAAEHGFPEAVARMAQSSAALLLGGSGSAALAHLACGRIHGWLELYPPGQDNPWDWHPGDLLVREAGGQTLILPDSPWRLAAVNQELLDALQDLLP